MSSYDPSKLTVTFIPWVTKYSPVDERKYTLAISSDEETMSLSIGKQFLEPLNISENAKIIYGSWQYHLGSYILFITIPSKDQKFAMIGKNELIKHMEIILSAIINSDLMFFSHYPWLLESPIYVKLENNQSPFEDLLYCGKPRNYIKKPNHIMKV